MHPLPRKFLKSVLVAIALICAPAGFAPDAAAQTMAEHDESLVDRPIAEIEIEGLNRNDEQLVRNNLRTAAGDPYDPITIRQDVERLYRLGEFRSVTAEVELLTDGTVRVVLNVVEHVLIEEVQVVGNSLVSDQELLGVVRQVRRGARDDFLIENAKQQIEQIYREKGHYLTSVEVDETNLEEAGILLFRVIEGPRVKVRAIEFEGNEGFDDKQLQGEVKTKTAFLFFRRGELNEDVLETDVAALDAFYKDRGYLDVRVDRRIELSPNNKEAKIVYIVDEGPVYSVRSMRAVTPDGGELQVYAPEQLAAMSVLKVGDVYSRKLLQDTIEVVTDQYQRLGYLDVQVRPLEDRTLTGPEVDLLFVISEGSRYRVGLIDIQGNFLTKDKVIRRKVKLDPGRPFDATQILSSRQRIRDTRLFSDVRITVQEDTLDAPDQRDVLVEVKERDTGSVNFGVAFGSDTGAFADFSLRQNNFDVADVPASFDEFIRGRAFRGAGQRFSLDFRPGDDLFVYSASLTEPNFLETDTALTVAGSYTERIFNRYDEERISLRLGLGRQIGDVWTLRVDTRFERVQLDNIDPFAPTEVFMDAGPNSFAGVGFSLVRSTLPPGLRPGRGTRFEFSYEKVGLFGGDFDFNKITAEYVVFITLAEDFLGRRSILRLNTEVGYEFGDRPPVYEQFYRGGRSFRGFDFREISPKGIRADTGGPSEDPVGGEWMFFLGAQYEFPLFDESVTGVVFVDSGTVTDEVGFDMYRVSVGTGVRLRVPALGPVPIAFDLAWPILKEDTDDEEVLSFSAELPF